MQVCACFVQQDQRTVGNRGAGAASKSMLTFRLVHEMDEAQVVATLCCGLQHIDR